MIDYTMPDEVRKRLHIPAMAENLEAIATAKHGSAKAEQTGIIMPSHHYHLYAEVGWAGAHGPILPTLEHVNAALRTIAAEPWCKDIVADTHTFIGTLFFARKVKPDNGRESVRLCVDECDGKSIARKHGVPCNRLGVWR